ncbi:hypothetical protein Ciccas_013093 [Cichlidogyrus casuarinus]|uniref:Uncharacterized protein n=1 Tax=Cichlidogyrus casuarinus TaxID=1844966 RepID=A0ABD2PNB2_9PLAT
MLYVKCFSECETPVVVDSEEELRRQLMLDRRKSAILLDISEDTAERLGLMAPDTGVATERRSSLDVRTLK